MKELIVTTESGSDISDELRKEYGIRVIPMSITMEETSYLDGSIPVTDIYAYYDRTKKIPKTSGVNVGQAKEFLAEIREEYPDTPILHVAYSSPTTCSYQSMVIAMQEFDNVYIVDSLNVTSGLTSIAIKAVEIARASEEDRSIEDIMKELSGWIKRARTTFLPGNLEYLKAGGRVTNAAYIGASILKIKPMIQISDEGLLVAEKKYRGSLAHITPTYAQEFFKNNEIDKELIYVMYTQGTDQATIDELVRQCKEYGFETIRYIVCGCVITCHSGPNAIGLSGFTKP